VRRLIVSDIHSNREALDAVLADARKQYDEVICCGDVVGYGASPAECIDWVRKYAFTIVRGNHDRACAVPDDAADFNPAALTATLWTHQILDRSDLLWLMELPQGPVRKGDYEIAHGSPSDEDAYLFFGRQVAEEFELLQSPICFIGHTHVQGGWSAVDGRVAPLVAPRVKETERVLELREDALYFINPGSIGQPRDGDPRAGYAIWDTGENLVRFRRVPYDVRAAQQRILNAGLPEYLATRLAAGR
jgi:diadenosine tetraphosphatase ApaH/serine/threonine PP2A family protein phosphatase